MGRLRQQKRGKGKPKYIAPSHRYAGKVIYPKDSKYAEIIALVNCIGHQSPLMLIKDDKGKEYSFTQNIYLLPESLDISGKIDPEIRYLQPSSYL